MQFGYGDTSVPVNSALHITQLQKKRHRVGAKRAPIPQTHMFSLESFKILEFGEQVTYVRWSAVRHSKMRCLVPSYQISAELNNKKRLNESVKMKGIAMMGVRMKKTTKANTAGRTI